MSSVADMFTSRLSQSGLARMSLISTLTLDQKRNLELANVDLDTDSECSSLNDSDFEVTPKSATHAFLNTAFEDTEQLNPLKFKNIANLDLALLSGHFRGKLFKYLDKNKKSELITEDETPQLDEAIWSVCQR